MNISIQKIIIGKRTEPLSAIEIKQLFKLPTTPEFNLSLLKALNKDKLDVNNTLIQAINDAKNREDLIPIALALRAGADPNLYVKTPGMGNIHILGFTYFKLSQQNLIGCTPTTNNSLVNSIVMMLVATGTNPNLPVFKSEDCYVKLESRNVITWLCDSGYETILNNIDPNLSNARPESVSLVGTFLDCKDLVKINPKLSDIIASHAHSVLDKYITLTESEEGLKLSIRYLNLTSFEAFIKMGSTVEYWNINNMLIKMKEYKKLGDLTSLSTIFNMLLYSISHGSVMDLHQLKMIEQIDPELVCIVVKKYSEPRWRKTCKICKGDVNTEMKLMAYHLNLNPEYNKKYICQEISKITCANTCSFKRAAIIRQEKRISNTLSDIINFINHTSPQIILRNKSLIVNVYDYVDMDLVFYKDHEGASWAFTRDKFTDLIDTRKNPYTQCQLPIEVLDEMEKKREYHILLGLDCKLTTVSQAVDELVSADEINDITTQKITNRFYKMANNQGVSKEYISNLTLESLENSLKDINIVTDITSLNKEYALDTFAVSAETVLRKNKYMVSDFFSGLRMNSRAMMNMF